MEATLWSEAGPRQAELFCQFLKSTACGKPAPASHMKGGRLRPLSLSGDDPVATCGHSAPNPSACGQGRLGVPRSDSLWELPGHGPVDMAWSAASRSLRARSGLSHTFSTVPGRFAAPRGAFCVVSRPPSVVARTLGVYCATAETPVPEVQEEYVGGSRSPVSRVQPLLRDPEGHHALERPAGDI